MRSQRNASGMTFCRVDTATAAHPNPTYLCYKTPIRMAPFIFHSHKHNENTTFIYISGTPKKIKQTLHPNHWESQSVLAACFLSVTGTPCTPLTFTSRIESHDLWQVVVVWEVAMVLQDLSLKLPPRKPYMCFPKVPQVS